MVTIPKIKLLSDQVNAFIITPHPRTGNVYCLMDDVLDITTQDKIRQGIYTTTWNVIYDSVTNLIVPNAGKAIERAVSSHLWQETELFTTPKIPSEIQILKHFGWMVKLCINIAAVAELAPALMQILVARRKGTSYGIPTTTAHDILLEIEDEMENITETIETYVVIPELEHEELKRGNVSLEAYTAAKYILATVTTAARTVGGSAAVTPLLTYNLTPEETIKLLRHSV